MSVVIKGKPTRGKTSQPATTAKATKLLEDAPRDTQVQLNIQVSETVKNDFQAYCAQLGKGRKQGEVFADVWDSFKAGKR